MPLTCARRAPAVSPAGHLGAAEGCGEQRVELFELAGP